MVYFNEILCCPNITIIVLSFNVNPFTKSNAEAAVDVSAVQHVLGITTSWSNHQEINYIIV